MVFTGGLGLSSKLMPQILTAARPTACRSAPAFMKSYALTPLLVSVESAADHCFAAFFRQSDLVAYQRASGQDVNSMMSRGMNADPHMASILLPLRLLSLDFPVNSPLTLRHALVLARL